ncbi:MAG: hypothetical protein AMK69_13110 [Nitrospira bacterium SG8_3]|nr:MAG: hypothetical protein AMK69_13110 [Nitrospira bacterium SG8_3]
MDKSLSWGLLVQGRFPWVEGPALISCAASWRTACYIEVYRSCPKVRIPDEVIICITAGRLLSSSEILNPKVKNCPLSDGLPTPEPRPTLSPPQMCLMFPK